MNEAADWYVTDMTTKNYYGGDQYCAQNFSLPAHCDSLGRMPPARVKAWGYPQGVGENLAAGFSNAQFAKEKEVSHGIFSSTQWTPAVDWPGAKEFAKAYQERYGKQASYHAATAYTAMWVLAHAASQANGDREKTREALDSGTWETLDGTVKFADYEGYTNQNKHQMLVEQILDGKFITAWPKALQSGKPLWPFPGWK